MVQIAVGLVGLFDPPWADAFYPEDIPLEWRLDYYANEFPVVVSARGDLAGQSLSELVESAEGLEQSLTFWVPEDEVDTVKAAGLTAHPYDPEGVWSGAGASAASGIAIVDADVALSRRDLRAHMEQWLWTHRRWKGYYGRDESLE
ncbi:MAG: hypothetical protein ACPGUC_10240 [Gammaproteobacteria bacterium]